MKLIDNRKYLQENKRSRRYETTPDKETLALTIADGDFKVSKQIIHDLIKHLKTGDISYTFLTKDIVKAVNTWYNKRYQWDINTIKPENFLYANGVIHIMQISLLAFTHENQGVIYLTPVYPPFIEIIADLNRKGVPCELNYDEEKSYYTINFEKLEEVCKDPNNKILFLCSPHNPVGRVWRYDELKKIIDLVEKYNLYLVTDEIWQDIIFGDYQFISVLEFQKQKPHLRILSCSSLAKTFNLGGAQMGYAISFNLHLMQVLQVSLNALIHYASHNMYSSFSLISGYTHEKNYEWYQKYLRQIEQNYKYVKKELETHTNIKVTTSEALYVNWLNFSHCNLTPTQINKKLAEAKIQLGSGNNYGNNSVYFWRLNFAVSTATIKDFVARMIKIFS